MEKTSQDGDWKYE